MTLEHQIARMSPDERRITELFVDKLMGEGREEYGALDLATDGRTVEDLLDDWLGEFMDSGFYAFVISLHLRRLGKN